jgi:hypothetical protein
LNGIICKDCTVIIIIVNNNNSNNIAIKSKFVITPGSTLKNIIKTNDENINNNHLTTVASESIKKVVHVVTKSNSLVNIDSELGQKRSITQSINIEEITKYYPTKVLSKSHLWSNKLNSQVPLSRALLVYPTSQSCKYRIAIASSIDRSIKRLHSGYQMHILFENISDAVLFCMIFYYHDEDARGIASYPSHYDPLSDFPQELPEVYLTDYIDMVYSKLHDNPEPSGSKDDYIIMVSALVRNGKRKARLQRIKNW